ncbi:MAG: hypothetical protein II970_07290 [Paludibacteraceae bacterium]|nr:hypothetical protein [Paludibacteraceae bacterium]
MKNYVCPDCGKTFEEGNVPASCPNCGCPSSDFFKEKELTAVARSVDATVTGEKVYYSDGKVHITNKIWSLGGWDEVNTNMSGVMYIPVKSISCVDITRNRYWWIPLIIGILLFLFGIYAKMQWWSDTMPIIMMILGAIFGIIAFVVRAHRILVIKPHNSMTQFSFHLSNPQEAMKYLKPMLQCLKENL